MNASGDKQLISHPCDRIKIESSQSQYGLRDFVNVRRTQFDSQISAGFCLRRVILTVPSLQHRNAESSMAVHSIPVSNRRLPCSRLTVGSLDP